MFARWLDPHIRTSIALALVILSIAGLVLADRGQGSIWPRGSNVLTIATSPPTPPSNDPSPPQTSATVRATAATARFALSQGRILASGTRPLFLEVRVSADERTSSVRTPISMVLVIDTSGSMQGQKLQDAKRASIAMLDQMHNDDMVAVVRYASDAQVAVPLVSVGEGRERARNAIERMYASGNTDIANALRIASRLLAMDQVARPQRIVLVTDGRDTSGSPRDTGPNVARSLAARGITASALGIGVDYDAGYLTAVADRGRGNYEYIGESAGLERFLTKELRETGTTTVQDANARIDLPRGWHVRDVWGATWDPSSSGVQLSFGSLFSGDERRAIVSLEADAGSPGSWTTVRATFSWVPVSLGSRVETSTPALRVEAVGSQEDADASVDPSVLASTASLNASRREQEAAAAFERGDRQLALQLNRAAAEELDKAASRAPAKAADRLRAQKRAYEGDARVYSSSPAGAAPARPIGARENSNLAREAAY
ncbi:MAG: VWA domain-containing protein [Deltaproteobacteria bacterium]|nr:VWA domain-containing protein [Deltaproteobacteria bacterium]